jgi:hypothetical protein
MGRRSKGEGIGVAAIQFSGRAGESHIRMRHRAGQIFAQPPQSGLSLMEHLLLLFSDVDHPQGRGQGKGEHGHNHSQHGYGQQYF